MANSVKSRWAHKLTLTSSGEQSRAERSWTASCVCGWTESASTKALASGEYKAHRDREYSLHRRAALPVLHPCGDCAHAHNVVADPSGTSTSGPGCLLTGDHATKRCDAYAAPVASVAKICTCTHTLAPWHARGGPCMEVGCRCIGFSDRTHRVTPADRAARLVRVDRCGAMQDHVSTVYIGGIDTRARLPPEKAEALAEKLRHVLEFEFTMAETDTK
jgi:hypothetical protein